eukprot:6928775-Prymnesium_polylepis.1
MEALMAEMADSEAAAEAMQEGGQRAGGRQTALPRRVAWCVPPRPSPRRAAATHRTSPRRRTGRPPARPGA